jgi:Zn-dependent protease with chaperone function
VNSPTGYRYTNERLILALTVVLVTVVIAVTATATVCLSALFVIAMLLASYGISRAHHRALVAQATQVTAQVTPALADIVADAARRLQPGPVEVFVSPGQVLNAYTFGLVRPRVVVLYRALVRVMDADELRFVVGHELGHVRLGHTTLNSLVGGMAGIPSPFVASAVLAMAFLWWNRACEFSADRAGLLACAKPDKAISALVKLAAGDRPRSRQEYERVVARIEAEDDHALANLGEALSSHPMMIRRIEELRRYAGSSEYRRLQSLVDRNLA